MHGARVLALSAFVSAVAGAPMPQLRQQRRDIAWVTETQAVIVTVPVTTTVWVTVEGQELTATATATAHTDGHPSMHHPTTKKPAPEPTVTAQAPSPTTTPMETPSPTLTPSTPSTTSTPSAPSAPPAPPAPQKPSPTSAWSSTTAVAAPSPSATSTDATGLTFGPAASGTSFTDGELTWFADGLGACGLTSAPSDHIVAVSHVTFDAYTAEAGGNPNNNPMCGKTVTITGADGSPYTATIVDRCVGCDPNHLDLSEDFFNTVTNYANGVMSGVSWKYD